MRNLKILEGGHPYIFVKILAKFKDKFWKVGLGPSPYVVPPLINAYLQIATSIGQWAMAVETRNNVEVSKEVVAEG